MTVIFISALKSAMKINSAYKEEPQVLNVYAASIHEKYTSPVFSFIV
jgi:hypothetical protein